MMNIYNTGNGAQTKAGWGKADELETGLMGTRLRLSRGGLHS